MTKKPDPKTDPCFYCTEETGRNSHCHGSCERFATACELKAEEKKKRHDFDMEHVYVMNDAQKKMVISNHKKYNHHGTRRK